jgi:hypothetical protein
MTSAKHQGRLGALSRFTKDVVGGFFTRNIRFAFGHAGDLSGCVSAKCSFAHPVRSAGIALAADGIH